MRFGLSGGFRAMRQIVRQKSITYSVTRKTDNNKGRFGERSAGTTTVSIDAWLFDPMEINADSQFGERLGGDLQGLAMPAGLDNTTDDPEYDDVFTHGGHDYEVEQTRGIPDENDPQLLRFSLQRVTN